MFTFDENLTEIHSYNDNFTSIDVQSALFPANKSRF